jgi:hypothetical protein
MDKNICNICKIRAYIQCDLCEAGVFFCSRGHLNSHKIKLHNALQKISNNTGTAISVINRKQMNEEERHKNTHNTQSIVKYISNIKNKFYFNNIGHDAQIDLRKLFEYIQNLKNEIESKFLNNNYIDAILTINKCLSVSNKFYQEDHLFVIDII